MALPGAGSWWALAQKFQLPIYFVGVGESVNDLRPFDAEGFVTALIGEGG